MPRQSIEDLRKAIEDAPEMTAQHRDEMLALVDSLATEVEVGKAEESAKAEELRGAIAVAGEVVRKRGNAGAGGGEEDHDLGDRLTELEEKVEMVALEHPVIANVLTAIARLV